MPWPNLTEEERDWIDKHGCIHGMYPDEDPIFCPKCHPDTTKLREMLGERCKAILEKKDEQL